MSFELPKKEQKTILPDNKEKISELEKLMINISGNLSELTELKPVLEETLNQKNELDKKLIMDVREIINNMSKHFDDLKVNLECEVKYSRELALQSELFQKKHEASILEEKLIETENRIDIFINDLQKTVKDKLQSFEITIQNLKTTDDKIEENIVKFNNNASSAAETEYKILKKQTYELLTDYTKNCQENLEVLKQKSIDFIKECEEQNKDIIKKIPKVNTNKYSLKEILIYISLGLSIIFYICAFIKK